MNGSAADSGLRVDRTLTRYALVRREIDHTRALRENTIEMCRLRTALDALTRSRRGAA